MKKDFVKSIPLDLPNCERQQKEKRKKRKKIKFGREIVLFE